ncbi:MAG: M12 family metallo-peptidase [Candidatus Binatia bacterium]
MTTLPQITCFILSAIFFSSCSLVRSEAPQRVVRVKAFADPSLRERNPGWDKELRGLIEAASDYFEREFGIRFVTQSAMAWPANEKFSTTAALLNRLKQDFPLGAKDGTYDLIVAFTAERVNHYIGGRARVDRIGNCQQGLANYVVTSVSKPYRYTGVNAEPTIEVIALIHELGHVFGAEHIDDPGSIMHENFDYRSEFDMKNRTVILKNRRCPFAK